MPLVARVASPNNGQGSILPITTPGGLFSWTAGGGGANCGGASEYISLSGSSYQIGRPDGTAITVYTTSIGPSAPTCSSVNGGALGSRTYWVRVAYVRNAMIYAVSGNTQITVPANKVLKVTSPAPKVGYPGYVVLISNVSGVAAPEVQQNPPTPVAVGTDYTEPTTGFINTISQANLFGANPWGAVTRVNGHGPGVQQFFYPYFDASMQGALTGDCGLVLALNSFGDPGGLGPDWFAAREQNSDGHLPLSNNSGGNFTITPPAVNTSTSGGNGGGGFRT